MPAPYTLTLAPQIGVELDTIPTDQVKLTLLPVIQGVKGDKGDVVDLNAGTGITINYATATLAVDTSVIATKTYAATAAQGAKADTAIQSGDLAPVAFSGLFSALTGQSAIFNVVYSAYTLGSNLAIAATDSLGQMLGKLQAQINDNVTTLGTKVDKITGKGLSTEDYSTAEKTKLSGIASGATANQTDTYLLSRTNHTGTQAASTITGLATVATSGSYTDLSNKPTIPAAQVQSDWNATTGLGVILNKPTSLGGATFNQARWSFTNFGYNAGGSASSQPLSGGYALIASSGTTWITPNTIRDGANDMGWIALLVNANSTYAGVTSRSFKPQTGRICRTIFAIYVDMGQSTFVGMINDTNLATTTTNIGFSIVGLNARACANNGLSGSSNTGSQNYPTNAVALPTNVPLVADIEYITDSSARLVLWNFNTNAKYIDVTFSGNGVPALSAPNYGTAHRAIVNVPTNYGVDVLTLGYMGYGLARPSFIVTPA